MTSSQLSEMCSGYFGAASADKLARMSLNMIMSDVGWTLWAAIQATDLGDRVRLLGMGNRAVGPGGGEDECVRVCHLACHRRTLTGAAEGEGSRARGSLLADRRQVWLTLKSETSVKKSPRSTPGTLRVAAVQMTFAEDIDGNLAKIEQAATRAAKMGADAVLFPECATTGYAYDFGSLRPTDIRNCLSALGQIAASLQTNLLVGSPVFAGRRLFNGLTVFDRAGRLVHVYAKCQLTDSDRAWFSPGNSLSLFSIDGVCATAIICHERRYPELVRLAVMAGAQVLFHPNAGMDALRVSRQTGRAGRDPGAGVRECDLLRVREHRGSSKPRKMVCRRFENRRPRRLVPAGGGQRARSDRERRPGPAAGQPQVCASTVSNIPSSWPAIGAA